MVRRGCRREGRPGNLLLPKWHRQHLRLPHRGRVRPHRRRRHGGNRVLRSLHRAAAWRRGHDLPCRRRRGGPPSPASARGEAQRGLPARRARLRHRQEPGGVGELGLPCRARRSRRPHRLDRLLLRRRQGELRLVLYRGHVSDTFVPYMDTSGEWYFRTYMDLGDYGFGSPAYLLAPLDDCPGNAAYMDGVLVGAAGEPVPNAICIFERYAGNVAWRHTNVFVAGQPTRESRPEVTLVVRSIATVGNYDYILDWEFKQTGAIRAGVVATGAMEMKAGSYATDEEVTSDVHGTLVAENTVAIYHDHFVTYRLDLDVDGAANSFVEARPVRGRVPAGFKTPRRSYWTVVRETAMTESEGRVRLAAEPPGELLMVNPGRRTKVGNPTRYQLVLGPRVTSLLFDDDYP